MNNSFAFNFTNQCKNEWHFTHFIPWINWDLLSELFTNQNEVHLNKKHISTRIAAWMKALLSSRIQRNKPIDKTLIVRLNNISVVNFVLRHWFGAWIYMPTAALKSCNKVESVTSARPSHPCVAHSRCSAAMEHMHMLNVVLGLFCVWYASIPPMGDRDNVSATCCWICFDYGLVLPHVGKHNLAFVECIQFAWVHPGAWMLCHFD